MVFSVNFGLNFFAKYTFAKSDINTKIKHVKHSQKDKLGKIIKFDSPIAISNVMFRNKEDWSKVSDDQKDQFFFIFNRYFCNLRFSI